MRLCLHVALIGCRATDRNYITDTDISIGPTGYWTGVGFGYPGVKAVFVSPISLTP